MSKHAPNSTSRIGGKSTPHSHEEMESLARL
jgi:hypothetical protein